MDWDTFFMQMALTVASKSKDRSRKIGCVIVGKDNEVRSIGFNGFPRDVDDDNDARHDRPEKYAWTEHAERNAIYNAARVGIPTDNCILYTTWFPCIDCARGVVQSGIKKVITFEPELNDPQWGESFSKVLELFDEAGILVEYL